MTGSTRVTIGDVAERAGVSIATVSRVVNGRYGVATATHRRVQAVIDELGYESSLVARSLRSQRTNVIGILVAGIEPFSAELLKGAAKALQDTELRDGRLLPAGTARQTRAGSGATSRVSSGTLTDGTILVDADRDRGRHDAAGRRRRPPRRRIDAAHRRLAELRRCAQP